jgi:hypothetical protein
MKEDGHHRASGYDHDAPVPLPFDAGAAVPHDRRAELTATLPAVWSAIYGDVAGYLALFSGRREGRRLTDTRSAFYRWPAHAEAAIAGILREAAKGHELYQCAHLVTRPSRRKEDAAPLAALYVDLDHDRLPADVVPPSLTVESSPGKWQCYWRLTTPVPPSVGEQLNRQLGQAVGADKTGWDPTQLLRVPGGRNHKYDTAPPVRVVAMTGTQYDLDELVTPLQGRPPGGARQPAPTPSRPEPPGGADAVQPPVYLSGYAKRIWEGMAVKYTPDGRVDRSASLLRIARVLAGARLSRSAIVAALAERDVALGWNKYTEREDALEQYERIVDYTQAHR